MGKLSKAGLPGRARIPVLAGLGASLVLVAGLAPAALASSAASPVPGPTVSSRPDDGVLGNAPYCGRDYERLDGDLFIAYNDDSGDYTCLQTTDQQKATSFRVTTFNQDIPGGVGAYPNIFAGFEWGRHPKNLQSGTIPKPPPPKKNPSLRRPMPVPKPKPKPKKK